MKHLADSVGVRELRQNLSVYLRRVRAGATLKVTEHRRTVAVLAPAGSGTVLERLIASGRVLPGKGNLAELGVPRGRRTRRASRALETNRADRL
jgi:antitoxin (DNA-binding transcriptional repressor) of toxin-antitoxin stability system